jgi:hypothetical protein
MRYNAGIEGGDGMKKRGILLLTVVIVFSLSACSGKRPADQASSQPASVPASSAESGLPPKQSTSASAKGKVDKSRASSQLEEIDSTLESLKNLTGDLADVTSEDMSIPTP